MTTEHETALTPGVYTWRGDRRRGLLCMLAMVAAIAVFYWLWADNEVRRLTVLISSAVVLLLLSPWILTHVVRGSTLVTLSAAGITPHEWTCAAIPWTEVVRLRFAAQGVHRVLVIETTRSPAVVAALRPVLRALVRTLGWWVLASGPGLGVTLTLMAADDRAEFLAVLDELGYGPP